MSETIALMPLEISMLKGLLAREREIDKEFLQPLVRDVQEFNHFVEMRAGLAAGAIGTTHRIDERTGCILIVTPVETTAGPERNATAEAAQQERGGGQ